MTATSERIELYQGHQRHIRDPEERIAERDDVSRLLPRMNGCGHEGWVTCWRCLGAKKN